MGSRSSCTWHSRPLQTWPHFPCVVHRQSLPTNHILLTSQTHPFVFECLRAHSCLHTGSHGFLSLKCHQLFPHRWALECPNQHCRPDSERKNDLLLYSCLHRTLDTLIKSTHFVFCLSPQKTVRSEGRACVFFLFSFFSFLFPVTAFQEILSASWKRLIHSCNTYLSSTKPPLSTILHDGNISVNTNKTKQNNPGL